MSKITPHYIWAVPDKSLWVLSNELRALNVTHSVQEGKKKKIVDCKKQQPTWVHVTNKMKFMDGINFIVMAYSHIAYETNFPVGIGSLQDMLMFPQKIIPEITEPTVSSLIEEISLPSILTELQTVKYRTPVEYRKSDYKHIIDFLNGRINAKTANTLIKSGEMKSLIKKAVNVRNAVAYSNKFSPEEASEKFKVDIFDINFLTRSNK